MTTKPIFVSAVAKLAGLLMAVLSCEPCGVAMGCGACEGEAEGYGRRPVAPVARTIRKGVRICDPVLL